jgi:phenylalanine ammonia-lyase
LHHIGKQLFSQATELMNPTMDRGLPPSLAASDPSLNYHVRGSIIAVAAYTSELGFLANPVSTHSVSGDAGQVSGTTGIGFDITVTKYHVPSSLALISARATITSIEVLSMLVATYLYLLCQGNTLMDLLDISLNSWP